MDQPQKPTREVKCWVTAMQAGKTLCNEVFPCRLGAGWVEVKWDERFSDAAELGFDGPWSYSGEETIRDMEAFTLEREGNRIAIVPLPTPVEQPNTSEFEQLKSLLRKQGCADVPDGVLTAMLEKRLARHELTDLAAIIKQLHESVTKAAESAKNSEGAEDDEGAEENEGAAEGQTVVTRQRQS